MSKPRKKRPNGGRHEARACNSRQPAPPERPQARSCSSARRCRSSQPTRSRPASPANRPPPTALLRPKSAWSVRNDRDRPNPESPQDARAPWRTSDVERLDATPERLAARRGSRPAIERGPDRLRRILDPFDVMRSTRALAPHDPKLNDMRWLIGEALRRVHQRAQFRCAARGSAGYDRLQRLRPAQRFAGAARSRCMRATRSARPNRRPAPPPGRS